MSYRSHAEGGSVIATNRLPSGPMIDDIAAIQYIYGANTSFNAGNTTYRWQRGEKILETIWDGGGIDTIDWSNQGADARIDLNDGKWSELGPAYDPDTTNDRNPLEKRTLAIAYDADIENANGGSGQDVIIGNGLTNNLRGFGGDDDIYLKGGGADRVDAGGGNDMVVAYNLNFQRIDGSIGRDQVRLKMSNKTIDLTKTPDEKTTGFEEIYLDGGNNTLVMAPSDVLNLSKTSNTVTVSGGNSNAVRLTDTWELDDAETISATTYSRYVKGDAVVRVKQGIDVSVEIEEDVPTAFYDLSAMATDISTLNGVAANGRSGEAASAAGDVNGDGYDDVIVGAALGKTAYVAFGGRNGLPADIDLDDLTGSNGFRLIGIGGSDAFGRSVRAAGDVNNDGVDDLIVGASAADPGRRTDAGASYVLFGDADGFSASVDVKNLDGNNGFTLSGAKRSDMAGYQVDGAGDVNGDGIDDLLVGAYGVDGNGDQSGSTYVVYGKEGGFKPAIDFKTIDDDFGGFRLDGVLKLDRSGEALRKAGDVNGDGYGDIVIGASAATRGGKDNVGEAYVVFGSRMPADLRVNLGGLDGDNGFRLTGLDGGDWFGHAVSGGGDINGDGFDDLVFGAPGGDPDGKPNGGEAFVVFGKASGFAASYDLRTLDGKNGFRIDAPARDDDVGFQVDFAGDVNGDGFSDLLVAAPKANKPGVKDAGAVTVVLGKADGFDAAMTLQGPDGINVFRINGESRNDQAGFSASAAGDVNGDGYDDVIMGAPLSNIGGFADAGKSYVIYGQDYTGAVTHEGSASNNKLLGTADADVMVAGAGHDLLRGFGGADVMRGGAGNDVLAIADNDFLQLIGGSGYDTVRLDGDGTVFDLRAIADNRVSGIERIALNGDGNKLVLNPLELANLSDETNTLTVTGNATNAVDMDFAGLDFTSTSAGGFTDYSLGALTLRVDNDVDQSSFFVDDFSADTSTTGRVIVGRSATGEIAPGNADKDWFKVTLENAREYRIDMEGLPTGAGTLKNPFIRDIYDENGQSLGFADDNSGTGLNARLVFATGAAGDHYIEAATDDPTDGGTYKLSVTLVPLPGHEQIDLADLGTGGMTLRGIDARDNAGAAVAIAGDLNGDGYDDAVVGAFGADPGGVSRAGETYVVFGGPAGLPTTIPLNGLDGSNGFRLDGVAAQDFSGGPVAPAGDVNNDGIDDLILGANGVAVGGNEDTGAAYVVFGKTTAFPAAIDLDDLTGANGFKVSGIDGGDKAGHWVDGAGDVNGDGIADIIVGAPGAASGAGEAYVVFGKSGGFGANIDLASLNGANGFRIDAAVAGGGFGKAVRGIGDVNNDGAHDVFVGAPDENGDTGAGYVVFGSAAGFAASLDVDNLNGTNGFRLLSANPGDETGFAASAAGDFNGDGIDDFLVSAPDADPNGPNSAGAAYLIFGKGTGFSANVNLATLNSINGFRLAGIGSGDGMGRAVSGIGDFDNDGFDDILLGAFQGDPGGVSNAGESYVVLGTDQPMPAFLNLDELDGVNGFRIAGAAADDASGRAVHGGGDVNGDGFSDLIIGAAEADPGGRDRAGEAYVVFGKAASLAAAETASIAGDEELTDYGVDYAHILIG